MTILELMAELESLRCMMTVEEESEQFHSLYLYRLGVLVEHKIDPGGGAAPGSHMATVLKRFGEREG